MRTHNPLAQAMGFLGDSMTGGTDYAAERMLRDEQRISSKTKRLPKRMDPGEREIWTSLGFEFGNDIDDLFVSVVLPLGWDTVPDPSHSMYVNVVDDRGRRRARYFYKGSFFDREAIMWNAERRFRCEQSWSIDRGDNEIAVCVLDNGAGGREIHRTAAFKYTPISKEEKRWETGERVDALAYAEASAWLEARFPECNNPLAYWSLPNEIDVAAFPEGYVFEADGGAVIAKHGAVRHRVAFDSNGSLLHGASRGVEAGDFDDYRKTAAWAALIANQPADPRPAKKGR